jgi:chemotaxis protein MotA
MGYVDGASVFAVVGGVVSATIAAFPAETLKSLGKIMGLAFKKKAVDLIKDVDMLIEIANIARREGILALEETVNNMEDPFIKKGIMLIIDGSDPELVRTILETDLAFLEARHSAAQGVLLQMSSFSPAFGMIGTLIGLINMLSNLDDMAALGPNMAVALVTTFYGVILANLIFIPMAKKLKFQSDNECLRKEMVLEGILAIQDGENPRVIREKLNAYLPNSLVAKSATADTSGGSAREE